MDYTGAPARDDMRLGPLGVNWEAGFDAGKPIEA